MARYRIILSALFLLATACAQSAPPSTDKNAQAKPDSTEKPAAAGTAQTDQPPLPPPTPGGATHLMGFEEAKRNLKGKLSIADGKLKFDKSAIDISAIQDVFTGSESRQ